MKIYTRTGDDGTTGLFGGPRVAKDDARIEAYGTVDELNACLGIARHLPGPAPLDRQLEMIQHGLFAIGAELASPDPQAMGTQLITDAHIAAFENWIDAWEQQLPSLRQFVLPAGTPLSAHLHLARAVCRRAERRLVSLMHHAEVSQRVLHYMNRLSDLLFVQSRAANHLSGAGDIPWQRDFNPTADADE